MKIHSYLDLLQAFDNLIAFLSRGVTARSHEYVSSYDYLGMASDYKHDAQKLTAKLCEALNLYQADGFRIGETHQLRKFRIFTERGFQERYYPEIDGERAEVCEIVKEARAEIVAQYEGINDHSLPVAGVPKPERFANHAPAKIIPPDASVGLAKTTAARFVLGRLAVAFAILGAVRFVWVSYPSWVGKTPTDHSISAQRIAIAFTATSAICAFLNYITRKR